MDRKYYEVFDFSAEQIEDYWNSALRDFEIAEEIALTEVKFRFAYDALLKFGIFALATRGYRVRSIPGHHQKILEGLGHLLKKPAVFLEADALRRKRNTDLYHAGLSITEKEANDAVEFVSRVKKFLRKD